MPAEPPSAYDLDKRLYKLEDTAMRLEKQLDEINKSLNRLVWSVGLAFLAGITQWIMRGGIA
jgi:hypothetical protein